MPREREIKYTSVFNERKVRECFERHNIKPIHLNKLWRKLMQNEAKGIGPAVDEEHWVPKIVGFPVKATRALEQEFKYFTTKVVKRKDATNNDTTKLLLQLQDGNVVETVLIRHENRTTLCVSSQVGCAMGCRFCATGTLGLLGNLTAGEILEQLVYANRISKIRNVVFMGMGEPLHNYEAVLGAVQAMVDGNRFSLQNNRVTISTVGVTPAIRKLTAQAPYITLALSLHAPNQQIRKQIVPVAQQYPFAELLQAVDGHMDAVDGRRVFMEYILLAELNDTVECAHELGKLLKPRQVKLNLIPYNPTEVKVSYKTPSDERINSFYQILVGEYGIFTTVRRHMGRDTDAACGQLALKQFDKMGDLADGADGGSSGGGEGGCSSGGGGSMDIEDLVAKQRGDRSSAKPNKGGKQQQPKSTTSPPKPSLATAAATTTATGEESTLDAHKINQTQIYLLYGVLALLVAILAARVLS